MRAILSIVAAFILSAAAIACAPTVNTKASSGQIVGIINEFPETPNYIKKRTLVFRHQKTALNKDRFKDYLTKSTAEYLASRGYKAIVVADTSVLKDGRADMVVEIRPMDIYKHDGTLGYGFYDRKILGVVIKQPARSYVCMNMRLHAKGKVSIRESKRQESFSKLDFKALPDTPDQLTESQKQGMSENLEKNIRETVTRALSRLGV